MLCDLGVDSFHAIADLRQQHLPSQQGVLDQAFDGECDHPGEYPCDDQKKTPLNKDQAQDEGAAASEAVECLKLFLAQAQGEQKDHGCHPSDTQAHQDEIGVHERFHSKHPFEHGFHDIDRLDQLKFA